MPASQLSATVRSKPGVAIIDLQGEINAFAEEALTTAYTQAEQANPATVVLNFSKVDYINSTGIALIVGILAQARRSSRRILAYGLSAHYVEIFEITRLADFMHMFPDESSALGATV